jgi:hypothetical protein
MPVYYGSCGESCLSSPLFCILDCSSCTSSRRCLFFSLAVFLVQLGGHPLDFQQLLLSVFLCKSCSLLGFRKNSTMSGILSDSKPASLASKKEASTLADDDARAPLLLKVSPAGMSEVVCC